MPRLARYHIPAPQRSARSPGSAYCGAEEPFKIRTPLEMRRWVVEMAALGKASQFCPRCLARMLDDANRSLETGAKGAQRRQEVLSPEVRQDIAKRAIEARWTRYRARKAIEARAGIALVAPQRPAGAPTDAAGATDAPA